MRRMDGKRFMTDLGARKAAHTKELVVLLLAVIFILLPGHKLLAAPVPDTGQAKCYNGTEEIACPSPGEAFYGQDAQYNFHPRSYTKLDAAGNALPDNTTSWTMVKDNVTGLIWEMKTDDDTLHDKDKKFTWCNTDNATNGGDPGTCGEGAGDAATDTQAFINALNAANYGGHNDWRMPTIKELSTLVNRSIPSPGPAIDTAWFPNTVSFVSSYYLSSSVSPGDPSRAFSVSFLYGLEIERLKALAGYVRAVRGGQSGSLNPFVNNLDGTVTDKVTGLMWQKATASGTYNWEQALAYAAKLNSDKFAGYSDWRLPDVHELQSLVDYFRATPAVDPLLANETFLLDYWSSTTYAGSAENAWVVNFDWGSVLYQKKYEDWLYVRVVRGGQSAPKLLFANFTNYGLYKYESNDWHLINGVNPDKMTTSGGVLYADFQNYGLYKYDGGTWEEINRVHPSNMLSSDGKLFAVFTDHGFYKYDPKGWKQMNIINPNSMTTSGGVLYADFKDYGLYKYVGETWTEINKVHPTNMLSCDGKLYATFDSYGFYKYENDAWNKINSVNPDKIVASGGVLYADFKDYGLYKYAENTWTEINKVHPSNMLSSDGKLFAAFTDHGFYEYDPKGWKQMNTVNPNSMNISGGLLYCVFNDYGYYKYDGTTWTQINTVIPKDVVAGE